MLITEKQMADICDNYCKYLERFAYMVKTMPEKSRLFHEALNLICDDCPLSEVKKCKD